MTTETNEPAGEDPDRPFDTWLEAYLDLTLEVSALGELGTKCREAAGGLVDELIGDQQVSKAARLKAVRVLTWALHDSYHHDGWEYTSA